MKEKLNSTHSLPPPNMEVSISDPGSVTAPYAFKHCNYKNN
jgi:hypothetical protein